MAVAHTHVGQIARHRGDQVAGGDDGQQTHEVGHFQPHAADGPLDEPEMFHALGLHAAIGWQLETFLTSADLSWHLTAETLEPRPAPAVEIALFRIAQEAINNAVRHGAARTITVRAHATAGTVKLSITDDGCGFDMKFAERLFAPFNRLHNQTEFSGSGIGLSIVKRIVSRHGGRIWTHSVPSEGSTFFLTLQA